LYVAPGIEEAKRFNGDPTHTGLLLEATGAKGVRFTITEVVATRLVQPLAITTREYVPALEAEAPVMTGFCKPDVNELGPFQLYVTPVAVVESKRVLPLQTGLLLLITGVGGMGFTTTATVAVLLTHPPEVTVTE
jgi:hypothetical protein